MKLAILKERRAGERRVAGSPDTVKKFKSLGLDVVVEAGAGDGAAVPDAVFQDAGATIAPDVKAACDGADIVLKVQRPLLKGEDEAKDLPEGELGLFKKGAVLVAQLNPYDHPDSLKAYADAGIVAFAMELMPRITRAQSMDVLSSQSNLAGYRAVLEAATAFGRALPMMMTAAGTVPPAKCLVMGAGVAGLQAIATARRLGAVVSATDVRPATKEQVESLGGSFVAVENEEFKQAEAAGGYAKEMSDDYKKQQAELIAETIKKMDIVITTALIPGRPAPTLVTEDMVKSMKPGSVIVDLAVERGGNCPLSEPGKVVEKHGVILVGYTNVPGRVPVDASWVLRATSAVVAVCSSTAEEIEAAAWSISPIALPISAIAWAVPPETCCTVAICWAISSVALPVWLARFLTSEATTAKPLPASPARAASIVALSASRLVCSAMSLISVSTLPIRSAASTRLWTVWSVASALSTARLLVRETCSTWVAISLTDIAISSDAAATVATLAVACSAAPTKPISRASSTPTVTGVSVAASSVGCGSSASTPLPASTA